MSLTPIQQFYKEKTIFLTGVTGFLGKSIIEKLLRSCNIKKIYVLIREKKGVEQKERLEKLLSITFFDRAKQATPDYKNRIEIVNGDLASENLGISKEIIEKLKKEIEIVIHCAATVSFDEPLRKAAQLNIIALKCVIDLSKEFRYLKSFVHVSTCYTNCVQDREAYEKFYPPPRDPAEFIEYVKNTSDEELAAKQSEILGVFPNTYIFTKSIGEDLVRREARNMPICIFRPSVVTGCLNDPIPGWNGNNLIGPYGIMIGVVYAAIRTIYADQNILLDFVPLDMNTNAILAAGQKTAVQPKKDIPDIYQFASAKHNPLPLFYFIHYTINYAYTLAPSITFWLPFIRVTNCIYAYIFYNFLFHTVPAYIVDAGLRLSGRKPLMMKIYGKVAKIQDIYGFFMKRSWIFHDDNTREMYAALTERDKELFNFDIKKVEWEVYWLHACKYIRINVMKDPMPTLRKGIRRYQIFSFINLIIMSLLLYFVYYLFRTFVY